MSHADEAEADLLEMEAHAARRMAMVYSLAGFLARHLGPDEERRVGAATLMRLANVATLWMEGQQQPVSSKEAPARAE